MAKKNSVKAYYNEFKKKLDSELSSLEQKLFPEKSGGLFINESLDATFLKSMEEGVTLHPLRDYQKQAIYTLHLLYQQSVDVCKSPESIRSSLLKQSSYKHIRPLIEKVDSETGKVAPFLGFEMATGSGKTMLMGASIYYLNKMHNIQNFLIITPPSKDIYNKTIRNFTIGSSEAVWNDEVPFKFNVINGDNYQDTKDLFRKDVEANIFIFNISKFGTNATNTKKEWESSEWKDKDGNTISLLDFLSQNELVIITDEAHHAQNRKSKQIINAFHPTAVLEYTATAIEGETNKDKKNQTIVYKYDIRRFLDDKFGKKVRVLALPSEEKRKGKKTEISDLEIYKIQTFFLVHLVKKKALASDTQCRDLKCIGFVKVKNEDTYAQLVTKFIQEDLSADEESLQLILEKAEKEDTETTNLILEMYKNDYNSDITLLQKAINEVAQKSFLYTSKSVGRDKANQKRFDTIRQPNNKYEIVIFIDKLNEGIDMPNIYTMVVINDTPSEFKTSVKQIVGRGVRLNKDHREYDEVTDDDLITHTEKLHIVCDKGASFEEVVLQIQKEFGLNDKTFAMERGKETLVENAVKIEKLKGIQIPRIKIDFKRKIGVSIKTVIENFEKIVNDYIESNTFNRIIDGEVHYFLKYTPNEFFTEVDLFADASIFHKEGEKRNWNYTQLEVTPKGMKDVHGRVIAKLKPIPDVPKTYKTFMEYGVKHNEHKLHYYHLDDVDEILVRKWFIDSFVYFYINYVEVQYFVLDLDSVDSESNTWLLSNAFTNENIKVRTKDINNDSRKSDNIPDLKEKIKNGYYFYGYENSAYDYDKFDSYPEKKLADYVNNLIEENGIEENKPFWLRNERNIFFEYGSHKYYPDFIFFYNKIIYVLEIKGEAFSNPKKNRLLLELEKVEGMGKVDGYKGVVIFEYHMNKLDDLNKDFNQFIVEAEAYFEQVKSKGKAINENDVPNDLKFVRYVPAYEAKQAYNKLHLNKTIKSNKWLEVKEGKYPQTTFATFVKNDDLGSELKDKWILMNSSIPSNPQELVDQNVLCYHPNVPKDDYKENITIRRFNLKTERMKMGMFDEEVKVIELVSASGDILKIDNNHKDFVVIGIHL